MILHQHSKIETAIWRCGTWKRKPDHFDASTRTACKWNLWKRCMRWLDLSLLNWCFWKHEPNAKRSLGRLRWQLQRKLIRSMLWAWLKKNWDCLKWWILFAPRCASFQQRVRTLLDGSVTKRVCVSCQDWNMMAPIFPGGDCHRFVAMVRLVNTVLEWLDQRHIAED